MHEKHAALAREAVIAYQAGEVENAARLCRQAIAGLAGEGAYPELLTVLGNLATIESAPDEKRRVLAQAVWLALALEAADSILYVVALFQALPEGSPLEESLAAAALMEARRGKDPDVTRAEMAMKLTSVLARRKRVVRTEADRFLRDFISNAPQAAAALLPALDEAVGESWEFDRGPVIEQVGKRLSHRHHAGH